MIPIPSRFLIPRDTKKSRISHIVLKESSSLIMLLGNVVQEDWRHRECVQSTVDHSLIDLHGLSNLSTPEDNNRSF